MRTALMIVMLLFGLTGSTGGAQAQANSCKVCTDQQRACMKNYAGPTCRPSTRCASNPANLNEASGLSSVTAAKTTNSSRNQACRPASIPALAHASSASPPGAPDAPMAPSSDPPASTVRPPPMSSTGKVADPACIIPGWLIELSSLVLVRKEAAVHAFPCAVDTV